MESSGSASNRQFPNGLPLIWCTECKQRRIVKRTSKQEWSLGQIFYCCPNYKVYGTGCPFWFWEEEYLKVLQTKGVAVRALQADGSRMEVAGTKQQGVESRRQEGVEFNGIVSVKEARELAAIGKEVVSLLKGICFVGVCMLLLVFAIFCLMLFK
ncbi:unnamed protein product [Urochloa decumbens]|uniref:GRF-type domain-containing protein n=1 Tax=Urochloa decumbens TaxID=240449 RepID=A0ABC9EK65_9POAL